MKSSVLAIPFNRTPKSFGNNHLRQRPHTLEAKSVKPLTLFLAGEPEEPSAAASTDGDAAGDGEEANGGDNGAAGTMAAAKIVVASALMAKWALAY